MKKTISILVLAAILVFCLYVPASAALPESYESSKAYYTVGGYPYEVYSGLAVMRDNQTAQGTTFIAERNYASVPVGYMGAMARLLDFDGDVVEVTGMSYNTSATYFHWNSTGYVPFSNCVCSKGRSAMYNGYSYAVTDAPQTVYAYTFKYDISSFWQALQPNGCYPTNSKGETYGSLYLAEYVDACPDLIAAKGEYGTEGYVRAEDLNPKVSSPKEAMEYMVSFNDNRRIPLYNSEGTQIGNFVLEEMDADAVAGARSALAAMKSAEAAMVKQAANAVAMENAAEKQYGIISVEEGQKKLLATLVDGQYPTNAKGQTYGSCALQEVVGELPDLVGAVATNGKSGYITADDYNGPIINNPEEAIAYMNSGLAYEPRVVPVYDLEGNVIGEFVIQSAAAP